MALASKVFPLMWSNAFLHPDLGFFENQSSVSPFHYPLATKCIKRKMVPEGNVLAITERNNVFSKSSFLPIDV